MKSALTALLSVLLLGACVSTRVSGERMVVMNERLSRLGVCVQRGTFQGGTTASSMGNRQLAEFYPHLVERLPVVFAGNGIESAATFCSSEGTGATPELNGFAHILKLIPKAAKWNSSSGSSLEVDAEAFQRSNGVIVWRGEVTLRTPGGGKFDAALADDLANKLLIELSGDGVIKQPTLALVAKPSVRAPLTHRGAVPETTGFAAISDVDALPLRDQGKELYRQYLALPSPKVFIIYEDGAVRRVWNDPDAVTKGLAQCAREGKRCWLYAVDDRVVWSADVDKRTGSVATTPAVAAQPKATTPPASQAAVASAPVSHRLSPPAPTGFAVIDDVDIVPVRADGKARYRHYLTLPSPKAFAIYADGRWRLYSGNAEVMTIPLDQCAREGKPCWLYAVDDQVVWSADVEKRIGTSAQLRAK
ncbi:MAG: hypothetical protein ABI605_07860 [Rhizobacter sp.]